tara:strand:- start:83 stop:223 length:141 start_codon:yes stop_codon:yes gene_type:complete
MNNERVKKLRAKNLELDRKRVEFYLTDVEKAELKLKLAELRKSDSI